MDTRKFLKNELNPLFKVASQSQSASSQLEPTFVKVKEKLKDKLFDVSIPVANFVFVRLQPVIT